MSPRLRQLLVNLDQAYGSRGWHGTTLRGALRGLSPARALWRPAPGRHNIWELMLHAAYWKYVVTRRLAGGRRGGFPRAPSNWPHAPRPADARAWQADIAVLDRSHAALTAVVAAFPEARLDQRAGSAWTFAEHIAGVAAHDLYHTGQIQLLKRLQRR
ncbi:MAG: DinB family protein [Gemmatimonadales bacterium]